MEKLLLLGINPRGMINSAIKLDYELYSSSYFSTYDTIKLNNEKHILHQKANKSCGKFEENYSSSKLLDFSKDYLEEVDKIILTSGISSSDFTGEFKKYKNKILGNKNVKDIENKFKFYKKIRNKFLTPETFYVNDIDEVNEIYKNNPNKQYIIKPVENSGGYGINLLNNETIHQLNNNENEWMIQEYITGINLSSSVLSTKNESKNIINSRLLTSHDFQGNDFIYIGNILPLDKNSILDKSINYNEDLNKNMKEISEDLMNFLGLIGSNGVDYILSNDELYIIEVNPRLQGTYECIENVLGINMLEAHIKACENKIIDIPKVNNIYSYKKLFYSSRRFKYTKTKLKNIYDIPYDGAIIEQYQPFLTLIENNKNFNTLIADVEKTSEKINKKF